MINISVFLYGKPSWDMNIESEDIDPKMLKNRVMFLKIGCMKVLILSKN